MSEPETFQRLVHRYRNMQSFIYKNMSKTEFRASNESLQTFRKDKNLFSEVCGESNDLMRDIPKCH